MLWDLHGLLLSDPEDAALASLKASESQLGTTVTDAEAALAAQKVVVETKSTPAHPHAPNWL